MFADPGGYAVIIVIGAILVIAGFVVLGKQVSDMFRTVPKRKLVEQPTVQTTVADPLATEEEDNRAIDRERQRIQEGNQKVGRFAEDQFRTIYIAGPSNKATGAVVSGIVGVRGQLSTEEMDDVAQMVEQALEAFGLGRDLVGD